MKTLTIRSCVLLTVMLATLSGCSSHCTCPPPVAAAPAATTIVEPSHY